MIHTINAIQTQLVSKIKPCAAWDKVEKFLPIGGKTFPL